MKNETENAAIFAVIISALLVATFIAELALYSGGLTGPVEYASENASAGSYSISMSGTQSAYPIKFLNITPSFDSNGSLVRFTVLFENPTNYTIHYSGGCFSPFDGVTRYDGAVINATYMTGAACDAIVSISVSSGSSGSGIWPYPQRLNITERGNYTFTLLLPYTLSGNGFSYSGAEMLKFSMYLG